MCGELLISPGISNSPHRGVRNQAVVPVAQTLEGGPPRPHPRPLDPAATLRPGARLARFQADAVSRPVSSRCTIPPSTLSFG